MQNFFKITNKSEIHHKYPYKDGLNILKEPFQKEGSCVPGGFYFTNKENLPHFYQHGDTRTDDGMWSGNSEGGWIRCIEVPSDALIVKDPDETRGVKWRCDKIILKEKYPLYDLNTIKTLNLYINRYYIENACMFGKTDILEWWLNTCKNLDECIDSLIDIASEYGHVDILELLKNSGLKLKYTANALDRASKNGHVNVLDWVLDWWLKSGLELKYTYNALDWASLNGHINVLNWWLKSGLKLKYTWYALFNASYEGHLNVLDWWLNSKLELKYNNYCLSVASDLEFPNLNVLDWWKKSGLPIEFPIETLNTALLSNDINILKWFEESGLSLSYTSGYPLLGNVDFMTDETIKWLNKWKKRMN